MATHETVGLVVAGAAARGAYEAGALSVLLPELERQGQRPNLLVGTSAGAINVALVAAFSHLPADEAAEEVARAWANLTLSQVVNLSSLPVTGGSYLLELLGIPAARLTSLLDTSPLPDTFRRQLDWGRLHENVRQGHVRMLGVVASSSVGRAVTFIERCGTAPLPPPDEEREIDYVDATIQPEHLLASSAIPVLFRSVFVSDPPALRGWYRDGLVRLNTPIKPAITLGAASLVLVASDPPFQPPPPPPPADDSEEPDLGDAAALLLHAVLVDRMVEDIRRLDTVNRLVSQASGPVDRRGDTDHYRYIPYRFVGPAIYGSLGETAERVLDEHYGGLRGLLSPFPLLSRLLGSGSRSRGEVMSYLFFDPAFTRELIEMGRRDARRSQAAPRATLPSEQPGRGEDDVG